MLVLHTGENCSLMKTHYYQMDFLHLYIEHKIRI